MTLVCLLAVLLPFRLWRASLEGSFWIDETYSVLLAHKTLAEIAGLTAADCHPPLYYVVLKFWLALGNLIGGVPAILWARMLNVSLWAALAVLAWGAGQSLFDARGGALLAWAVAGSAQAGQVANDIRGYGLAFPALFACFIIFMAMEDSANKARLPRRKTFFLWLAYAACASVAIWTHLLSGFVIALLAVVWLVRAIRRGAAATPDWVAGLLAHAAIVAGFLPWALKIHQQLAYINQEPQTWMTPPTPANWFRVFALWYPFGKTGRTDTLAGNLALLPGVLTVLIPAAAALRATRRREPVEANRTALTMGIAGLAIAIANVTLLWTVDRLGISQTFHGPRYPALTASFWAAGIVGLSLWASERLCWKRGAVWLLLAPWLLCSLVGQVHVAARETGCPLRQWMTTVSDCFPAGGEPLFVMPEELIPHYKKSLAEYPLHPIDDLANLPGGLSDVTILNVNPWPSLDRESDAAIRRLIEQRALSTDVVRKGFPGFREDYVVYRLRGLVPRSAEMVRRARP